MVIFGQSVLSRSLNTYIKTYKTVKGDHCLLNPPLFFFLSWVRLTDRLGATSFALGCGGIDHGCEMAISTKNLDPGVAFAADWEIGTVASLGDVGDLGTGISFPCVWKIGAATSLAVVWDLGTGAFLADAWRIGAASSLLRLSPGWAFPIRQQQRI